MICRTGSTCNMHRTTVVLTLCVFYCYLIRRQVHGNTSEPRYGLSKDKQHCLKIINSVQKKQVDMKFCRENVSSNRNQSRTKMNTKVVRRRKPTKKVPSRSRSSKRPFVACRRCTTTERSYKTTKLTTTRTTTKKSTTPKKLPVPSKRTTRKRRGRTSTLTTSPTRKRRFRTTLTTSEATIKSTTLKKLPIPSKSTTRKSGGIRLTLATNEATIKSTTLKKLPIPSKSTTRKSGGIPSTLATNTPTRTQTTTRKLFEPKTSTTTAKPTTTQMTRATTKGLLRGCWYLDHGTCKIKAMYKYCKSEPNHYFSKSECVNKETPTACYETTHSGECHNVYKKGDHCRHGYPDKETCLKKKTQRICFELTRDRKSCAEIKTYFALCTIEKNGHYPDMHDCAHKNGLNVCAVLDNSKNKCVENVYDKPCGTLPNGYENHYDCKMAYGLRDY